MEEFLRFVIKNLVDHPEDVVIARAEEGHRVVFRVSMRSIDLGKIIGRGGHTIQAIRSLLQASAQKHGQKVALEIIE